jgi:hypothetical protein
MRITSKGQVTIPQEIREQCCLLPHTQVRFVVEDGRVLPDHLDVYRPIPREAAFLAARAHAEYRARPAPPLDSPIEQPQGLAAADHGFAAQAAIEAHQTAAVVHRQGQQLGVGELARLQQPGSIDADGIEKADPIGPELVLGMADQFGHHGRHHRRRPRTVGVARLAQDPQHGVLGERAGGPAVGLSGGEPAMGRLVLPMAPIQQGDQHVHIEQGNTHGCVPNCLRDCVSLRAGSLKPIRPEGC